MLTKEFRDSIWESLDQGCRTEHGPMELDELGLILWVDLAGSVSSFGQYDRADHSCEAILGVSKPALRRTFSTTTMDR